jgi:hypothetical protein
MEIQDTLSSQTIWISPTEARKMLGVGRNKMYCDLLKRKDFPCCIIGSKYFVNRDLLRDWAKKQCEKR